MKTLIKPRNIAILETLQGQKVRVISMDPISKKVNVKSVSTGLPFTVDESELRKPV